MQQPSEHSELQLWLWIQALSAPWMWQTIITYHFEKVTFWKENAEQ